MINFDHKLKIYPEYYDKVALGHKKAELRSTEDMVFRVGDLIELLEFDSGDFTGRTASIVVTDVTDVTWLTGKPLALISFDLLVCNSCLD